MNNFPKHIAIIMDGNGRWAKEKGLPRLMGHKRGVESVRKITEACSELKIEYLTLYTFSEENWNRPMGEVSGLMKLFVKSLKTELSNLNDNNIRFKINEFDLSEDYKELSDHFPMAIEVEIIE